MDTSSQMLYGRNLELVHASSCTFNLVGFASTPQLGQQNKHLGPILDFICVLLILASVQIASNKIKMLCLKQVNDIWHVVWQCAHEAQTNHDYGFQNFKKIVFGHGRDRKHSAGDTPKVITC